MKKIGLLAGLGPEATIDYYKELINAFKGDGFELNYPEIILYSVNMAEFIGMMKNGAYDEATRYLLDKITAMKNAGAEFAAISANTPHLLFDRLKKQSALPLISIVEAAREETLVRKLKRPGLFGTGFTMNATFYHKVFAEKGIEVIVPEDDDKRILNEKLFTEIELGIFKEDTREILIDIIRKMIVQKNIDSLILGCTEFPLILTEKQYAGIPMLNTTKIHVDAIVKYCLS